MRGGLSHTRAYSFRLPTDGGDEMEVVRGAAGLRDESLCGEQFQAVIACVQPCSLQSGCFGQGRRPGANRMALRSLQFLSPLPKVSVNRTSYKLGDRSASLFGQRLKLLELLFFEEEGCPLHDHIVLYRHTSGNRP